ncbi:MAG: histidine phosphatase family protein [Candidatus Heimdallarchaeota archaeon]|nr:MAG: histidine phosphatase family protein [Candidatus Heimdallarchaeota archaeon]
MHLYIIRHGQTEFNIGEPRFRGQHDIPLSNVGVQQAEAIALALKSIPLDSIYYSRLQRAKITAEIIKKFHPTAQFIEEPHLITLNFGDWQGKFHKDVFKSVEERKRWYTNPNTFLIPNGETFYDILSRVHRLLLQLRYHSEPETHVALITHRIVIIHILLYLFKLDPSHFWDFHVNTASITQIDYNPDNTFRLVKLNKTTHLENLV